MSIFIDRDNYYQKGVGGQTLSQKILSIFIHQKVAIGTFCELSNCWHILI